MQLINTPLHRAQTRWLGVSISDQIMRQLRGHKRDVRAVAYTPDGRLLSGGGDNNVRLWTPATGEGVGIAKAKGPVYAIAVAPDGKTFAYAGRYAPRAETNFVYHCDLVGAPVRRFELKTEAHVYRRNAGTGVFERTLAVVPRSIWALSFSADGQHLAAACRVQGSANMLDGGGGFYWRIAAPNNASPLAGANINTVAFAPVGTQYAATRQNLVEFRELAPTLGEVTRAPQNASQKSAAPQVQLKDVGTGNITLPDKSHYHP